jgi:hypothetical protein
MISGQQCDVTVAEVCELPCKNFLVVISGQRQRKLGGQRQDPAQSPGVEAAFPRLQAEVDILKVNNLSAGEIASQARGLYDCWQTMQPEEKQEIVEVITDKIVIGKDEITITLCYAPSCKDMATWRKGSFLHPFCHLVIKVIRP